MKVDSITVAVPLGVCGTHGHPVQRQESPVTALPLSGGRVEDRVMADVGQPCHPDCRGADNTGSCKYKVLLQNLQVELFLLSVKIFQAIISFSVLSLLIPLQSRHTKSILVKGMFKMMFCHSRGIVFIKGW